MRNCFPTAVRLTDDFERKFIICRLKSFTYIELNFAPVLLLCYRNTKRAPENLCHNLYDVINLAPAPRFRRLEKNIHAPWSAREIFSLLPLSSHQACDEQQSHGCCALKYLANFSVSDMKNPTAEANNKTTSPCLGRSKPNVEETFWCRNKYFRRACVGCRNNFLYTFIIPSAQFFKQLVCVVRN